MQGPPATTPDHYVTAKATAASTEQLSYDIRFSIIYRLDPGSIVLIGDLSSIYSSYFFSWHINMSLNISTIFISILVINGSYIFIQSGMSRKFFLLFRCRPTGNEQGPENSDGKLFRVVSSVFRRKEAHD